MTTLAEAIRLFLAAKHAAGLSPNTVSWYRANLDAFLAFLERAGVQGSSWVVPETMEAFLESERGRVSASTVAARYRALTSFMGWLEERGMLGGLPSPMRQVARPKVPKTEPRRAEDQAIQVLLASIPHGDWIDMRDRLILRILSLCGLRAAELVGLHVHDVKVQHELLIVRKGKGGVSRPVPLLTEVAEAYMAYLMVRPEWKEPVLILSADGSGGVRGRMTVSGLRQMLRRRCAAAGVQYMNPHSFRHGLAIRLLNRGADMSLVQAVLGHQRITTTQRHYAAWTTSGLVEHFKEAMGGAGDGGQSA